MRKKKLQTFLVLRHTRLGKTSTFSAVRCSSMNEHRQGQLLRQRRRDTARQSGDLQNLILIQPVDVTRAHTPTLRTSRTFVWWGMAEGEKKSWLRFLSVKLRVNYTKFLRAKRLRKKMSKFSHSCNLILSWCFTTIMKVSDDVMNERWNVDSLSTIEITQRTLHLTWRRRTFSFPFVRFSF